MTGVPVVTGNGSVYATCDGLPRYAGYVQYASMVNRSIPATASTVYGIATSTSGSFSNPAPSCIIPEPQCNSLLSNWHATNYLVFPFNTSTGLHTSWPNGPPTDFPHCNASSGDYTHWTNDTSLYTDGSGCWLKGAAARLFYWPEPRQEGNHSCPDGTWTIPSSAPTSPANATALVTRVLTLSEDYYDVPAMTITMTSPTMYLSIQDLEARDASWGFVGAPIPATVIPVAPGSLMSMIIAPPLITNEALSSSAMSVIAHREWRSIRICLGMIGSSIRPVSAGLPPAMPCDTIFDDFYAPWVQIPATARSRGGVETCNLMFGWDPPVALTAAVTAAGPGQASVTLTTSDQTFGSTSAAPGPEVVRASTTPTASPELVTTTTEGAVAPSSSALPPSTAQSPAQTSVPDPESLSEADPSAASMDAQAPGQTTAADPGSSADGDPETASSTAQAPGQTTVASLGTSTDGDPGAASSAGPGASAGSPDQPADPSPTQGNTNGGAATTTAGVTPIASEPDSDPSSEGSSNRAITPIDSGSSAVTVVSDTSSREQVIAVSGDGSVTLSADQQSTIGTQQVSVNGQGQVVESSTTTITFAPSQGPATAVIPATASQDLGATGVAIAGQTLTSGGTDITTNGATISALSSGQLVIASDGTTSTASPRSNGVVEIEVDLSAAIVAVPSTAVSGVVVAGQTLVPGGSAFTVNGATISALSSGRIVIASADTTSTVSPQSNGVISLGNGKSATVVAIPTPGPSGVVVAGLTLVPEGSPITIAGETVSALPNGAAVLVVFDGTTSTASNGDIIGIGNEQFVTIVPVPSNAAALDNVVVAGQTLTPGGPAITRNGFTLSALPGSALLVETGIVSSTIAIAHGSSVGIGSESGLSASGPSIAGVAITLGGHTISAVPDGVVVDGTTVTASGLAQTIHGTVYSVNSDRALVVAESSTLGVGGFDGLIGPIQTAVDAMGASLTTSSSGSQSSSTKSAGSASIPGLKTSATAIASSAMSGAGTCLIALSSVMAVTMGLGTVLLGW
ncbi:hypothetical protein LTR97_009948 [Elasticomyces elasticus]|uniref:Uncharacterized protein n=1 Tax=Elasticomyces elasticus TaxID=574655 RepID=A0AAN7WA32_9PEZI|nr:hypothetical protein LTR97_009948 [Elasticomyces elasticus]